MSKKILVVYPRSNDYANIPRLSLAQTYEFTFEKFTLDAISQRGYQNSESIPDYHHSHIEDILNATDGYDAIISSDDYPGSLISSLCAEKWGLTSPSVESVLTCQHKYLMRQRTQEHVPEATPEFYLIDPNDPYVPQDTFPLFVKPIKSSFSRNAHIVHSQEQLEQICSDRFHDPQYLSFFNTFFNEYIDSECDASFLIGESLLTGLQVSLEGYVHNTNVVILGIIDAGMYEGTISFESFTYPSRLPAPIQERMATITQETIQALKLDNTLFSIELMYNPIDDSIFIIEINPRLSSQFADFFERVHGLNTYELAVALALGNAPPPFSQGPFSHAASFPMRKLQDHVVTKVPSEDAIKRCKEAFPSALITILPQEGQLLSDLRQDSGSFLYALINCAADSPEELEEKRDALLALLPFEFEPVH